MKNSKIDRILIKNLIANGFGDNEKLFQTIKTALGEILHDISDEDLKKERNKHFLNYINKIKDTLKTTTNNHKDNYNTGYNNAIKFSLTILNTYADIIKHENDKKH